MWHVLSRKMVIKEVYLSNEKFPIALFWSVGSGKIVSNPNKRLCVCISTFVSHVLCCGLSEERKLHGRFWWGGKQWGRVVITHAGFATDYIFDYWDYSRGLSVPMTQRRHCIWASIMALEGEINLFEHSRSKWFAKIYSFQCYPSGHPKHHKHIESVAASSEIKKNVFRKCTLRGFFSFFESRAREAQRRIAAFSRAL